MAVAPIQSWSATIKLCPFRNCATPIKWLHNLIMHFKHVLTFFSRSKHGARDAPNVRHEDETVLMQFLMLYLTSHRLYSNQFNSNRFNYLYLVSLSLPTLFDLHIMSFSNNLYYQWRKIYNYQYLDCFQAKHSCEIFITATYSCNWIIPMAIKQHILLKYKVEHRNKTLRMQLHCWTSKCQIFHLTKI